MLLRPEAIHLSEIVREMSIVAWYLQIALKTQFMIPHAVMT